MSTIVTETLGNSSPPIISVRKKWKWKLLNAAQARYPASLTPLFKISVKCIVCQNWKRAYVNLVLVLPYIIHSTLCQFFATWLYKATTAATTQANIWKKYRKHCSSWKLLILYPSKYTQTDQFQIKYKKKLTPPLPSLLHRALLARFYYSLSPVFKLPTYTVKAARGRPLRRRESPYPPIPSHFNDGKRRFCLNAN